jgi:hypothetical protein
MEPGLHVVESSSKAGKCLWMFAEPISWVSSISVTRNPLLKDFPVVQWSMGLHVRYGIHRFSMSGVSHLEHLSVDDQWIMVNSQTVGKFPFEWKFSSKYEVVATPFALQVQQDLMSPIL